MTKEWPKSEIIGIQILSFKALNGPSYQLLSCHIPHVYWKEEEVVVDQGTKEAEEEAEVLLISNSLQTQEDILVGLV